MTIRQATTSDLERATTTIALAFATDPVWSVALATSDGRTQQLAAYWRFFVDAAHTQDGLWLIDEGAAASVWIPPGGQELDPAATTTLATFSETTFGPAGAGRLHELFERFETNHPEAEPHAYLSLLATHPDHRGRGIGQTLLAGVLERWDRLGVPSYLESTNPANDHRYLRAGFRPIGAFRAVIDGAPITTMWRAVGGPN